MKRLQIRVSEQTHEDLLRLADGRPLQQYLERMIDDAIVRAGDPPRAQSQPKVPPASPRKARDVSEPEVIETVDPVVIQRGSPSPSLDRFGK